MKTVWIAASGVVSPLGLTSEETFQSMLAGNTGVESIADSTLSKEPIYAGKIKGDIVERNTGASWFENSCLSAMRQALAKTPLLSDRTLFILSTTKGNISFLEEEKAQNPRIHLSSCAKYLANSVGLAHYQVVSNACVSGVMALLVAKRLLQAGKYDHALVVGADVLSHFVVSGFQCLQALSSARCKPFDKHRNGINLGEAAAALVLTTQPSFFNSKSKIKLLGGGLSNDANHISGPSRTGEELGFAIRHALVEAAIDKSEIDFISAHGTATRYNDEMEAKAFTTIGLNNTPTNSMKGYFGHTLGAAGVLETAMSIQSLLANQLIPTIGCDEPDELSPINICLTSEKKGLNTCLKTASGFGGCNAAILIQKVD